jgi:hypothetical protein
MLSIIKPTDYGQLRPSDLAPPEGAKFRVELHRNSIAVPYTSGFRAGRICDHCEWELLRPPGRSKFVGSLPVEVRLQ